MKTLIFILAVYGISNILIYSSIFGGFRRFLKMFGEGPYSLSKLFSCMMCLPTWIGFILSSIFILMGYNNLSPFTSIGVDYHPLAIFLDGVLASGGVWLVHTLQEKLEK